MEDSIVVNTKLDNSNFTAGSKELMNAIRSLQQATARTGKNITSAASGYGNAMRLYTTATREAEREITNLSRRAAEMRREFNRKTSNTGFSEFMEARNRVNELEMALQEANTKAERLFQTKGVNSSIYKKAQDDADELSYKLIELQEQMNTMARPSDADILNMQKQEQAIASVESELRELQRVRDESLKPPYLQSWNKMVSLSSMISKGFGNIQYSAGMALTAIRHPIQAIDRGLGFIIQKAGQVASSLARMAGNAALSFLKKLASGAVNAAIQLARLAGNAIVNGLHRIAEGAKDAAVSLTRLGGSAVKKALTGLALVATKGMKGLSGLNKSARSTGQGFAASFKNILKYAFGIRSLFFLFRRLRSAVTEGLGEIAKRDPELKAAMSSMQKSFNGLKGSLASAFSPIVTAVAPALTTLINLLTQAVNAIGAFFAALTGKSVYMKSVGGIDATGKSAKGASKNVKELEKQLASFDDLDILKENDSSGSGSGGSGSGFEYEEAPIASGIKDFVDQLKELFAAGEYEQIGRIIADGLNKAIQKVQDYIKWDNIGPVVTKYMNALTGAINGLVDGFDWENLGATFGDGLNTITNTLLLWYEGIDWENLGKGFADGLNGLINRVDWNKLGKLLRERVHSVVSVIKGAVVNFEFGNAGIKFAQLLNSFFDDDTLWKDAGTTIDKMLKGLLDFTEKFIIDFRPEVAAQRIRDALGEIKWGEIADKFWRDVQLAFESAGSFVNALLGGSSGSKNSVDAMWERNSKALTPSARQTKSVFDELADTLSSGFNKLVADIGKKIRDTNVFGIVTSIGIWLAKVFDGISWTGVATTFTNGINKVLEGFGAALSLFRFNAGKNGKRIADAVNAAIGEVKWTGGPDSVAGIFSNAVIGAVNLADSFIENFDRATFAKNMKEALKDVDWDGIAKSIWKLLVDALSALGDIISVMLGGGVESTRQTVIKPSQKGSAAALVEADRAAGNKNLANYDYSAGALGKTLTNIIDNAFKGIKGIIESVDWSGLGKTIHDILHGMEWERLASDIWDAFKQALDGITQAIKEIYDLESFFNEYDEAKSAKEEARGKAVEGFDEAYKRNSKAALEGYGQAYGLNLEGLDYKESRRRIQIMSDAFLDGADGAIVLGKTLRNEGMSFEEIQKELGLTAEQLAEVEKLTREVGAFGEFGDWLTGTNRDQTGTDDYKRALAIATHKDAYNAVVSATENGEIIRVAQLMETYGLSIEEAMVIIDAATSAVRENTNATQTNTAAQAVKFEVDEHFKLDPFQFELDKDNINAIIQQSLSDENLNVTALVELGLPDESIVEVEKYFINKWNEDHPEAPITLSVESFGRLSDLIGGAEAYRLLYDSGVDMSNELAKGIAAGKINVKQSGEDLVIEFADGTSRKLSEKEKGLYKDSFATADKIRQGIKDGTLKVKEIANGVVLTFADGTKRTLKGEEADIYKAAKAAAEEIQEGFHSGLLKKWTNPIKTVKDKITGVIDAAKNVLGIASPSKVFKEIGTEVVEGFDDGVGTWKSNLRNIWSDISDRLKEKITPIITHLNSSTFTSAGQKAGTAMKNGLTTTFSSTASELMAKIAPIITHLNSNTFTNAGKTAATNVKNGLSSVTMPNLQPTVELVKKGWNTLSAWVNQFKGGDATEGVGLERSRWSWLSDWAEGFRGGDAEEGVSIYQSGWRWLSTWANSMRGGDADVGVSLYKSGWNSAPGWVKSFGDSLSMKVSLTVDKLNKTSKAVAQALGLATGGAITSGGKLMRFAAGGIIRGSAAKYLSNVPHYAGGTSSAHGTVFVAGENGPEVMGHINGRTEILNKSQIAQAIYSAVVSGAGAAVNALGSYIANHMATCANAIVATIAAGTDIITNGLEYYAPAMASGGIMPYDVSAQIAKSSAEIQETLDANNEDLIQTIISVIGAQTSTLVSALQRLQNNGGGMSAQQIINEINRNTQMYNQSPLKGV